MKKALLLPILLLTVITLKAQNSNLIFFTEQGERFSIVLNGVLQNETPATNIKVTDLPAPNYKLKVIFEDQKIPDLDKNLFFNQGNETSFSIRKNNKNQYVVRLLNEIPIEEAPSPAPSQAIIVYHTEPIRTTTTTTTTINNPGGAGIGLNVNDGVNGTNMNINLNMGGMGTQTTTTTTTTTNSSESYSEGNGYREGGRNGEREYRGEGRNDEREYRGEGRNDEREHHHGERDDRHYVLEGYNGTYGCPYPMSSADFSQAKQSISSKSFEDSKLTIAKQIINTNCLLSSQVKEIMLLFSFEDTRLQLAKFAYGYTLDIGNYYKVNDAFTFESSIDELNKYIAGFRR